MNLRIYKILTRRIEAVYAGFGLANTGIFRLFIIHKFIVNATA